MAAAGTLTLTQNSTTVTGSGTAFNTAVAAGGFIVATVGGTAYTLGILSVQSNTALTLTQAYLGPTTSGVAFDYVPLATLNLITSALAQQVSYALRANNLDRDNWQQIFSGTGNVTVRLPDGTSWTGPAWNGITTALNGKAAKGANSDITSLTGLTTPLSTAYGGTGATNAAGAWANLARYGTVSGTAAQGNDSRLAKIWATINGGTGSIAASNGVTSVTKNSTGDWTIFFGGFSDNSYSFSITGFTTGNAITTYGFATKAAGSLRIRCVTSLDGNLSDPSQFMVQIFGNS